MGMTGISKSQVSRLCSEIDGKIAAFLDRPLEGEWPYIWLDATYVKARRDGRIERDLRFAHAGASGKAHPPALQRGALYRPGQDDIGRLVECGAHAAVSDLGNA